jgi:group I intron endonuclease
MDMSFYIYKITNQINGKVYIGKSKNPTNRFKRHLYVANHKDTGPNQFRPIHAAILKYGKENFELEIVEECDSEEKVFERERYWISYYKSNLKRHPDTGYNLTDGGEGASGLSPSLETRHKISLANSGDNNGMSGRTHSPETKQNMIKSQAARKYRDPLTEEQKQHLSDNLKGKPRPMPIPLETKNEVISMYASGNYTKQQIADQLGLKYNSVVKILRTNKEASL